MEMLELMKLRHSVRQYTDRPIEIEKRNALNDMIAEINQKAALHIQTFYEEPKCFDSMMAHYGKFTGVKNYIALVGPKGSELEERLGYYGEQVVLKAQELGLNTCWVAMTHGKSKAEIGKGEKEVCLISIGYGCTNGVTHKGKYLPEVCNYRDGLPEWFLKGMEALGNKNVPDEGRVCFCSYAFANFLKQDSSFMKYGDASQKMLVRGVIGEVDGCKIVKVPASRLPNGAAFLITHPIAATAPKQLEEYKIHDNPPGVSGWLVEGRVIYDCFVLNEKADAIYYHGSQAVLKGLNVQTAGTASGKTTILVEPGAPESGNSWMYQLAADSTALDAVAHGTAITDANWTALAKSGTAVTVASGKTVVAVVEIGSDKKPLAYGTAVVNKG